MATIHHNLSNHQQQNMPDEARVSKQKYAIVVAEWNDEITNALLNGTLTTLKANGVREENIDIRYVPGTFELTYAATQLQNNATVKYNAIIILGCVIKGETPHFDYVCSAVTQGATYLNLQSTASPVIFGVLTTNDLQQAKDRSGGKYGNKGDESAVTAIKMANIIW